MVKTVKVPKKPSIPKFLGICNCYSRYRNRCEKWYSLLPKNGDFIRLVNLPNPINNPKSKSCYIGYSGVVQDMDGDGNFVLFDGKSVLIHNSSKGFEYEKI